MDNVLEAILRWRTAGRRGTLARVIAMTGFGGRNTGELLALADNGERAGSLLGGAAVARVEAASRSILGDTQATGSVIDVTLTDPQATSAGLACGGQARLLVQPFEAVPVAAWEAMAGRVPVALATLLVDPLVSELLSGQPGAATVEAVDDSLGGDDAVAAAGAALVSRGRVASQLVDTARGTVAVEAFVPVRRLVVVGAFGLSASIERQAALLGWQPSTTDGPLAVDAARSLGPADALVVLTHDPATSTPVLMTALDVGCGYVGALGSRRTQARRRRDLIDAGVHPDLVAGIHGPVGLDLGAGSPEETALAICAEVIAVRSGRTAMPLRDTDGPINA
jgi:xanthine dehydrogenase accessory factor